MLQNKLNVFGVRFAVSQLNQHPAAVVAEATEKNLSNEAKRGPVTSK